MLRRSPSLYSLASLLSLQVDTVSYAESKTTLLLEEALGGNSITMCIATLSPVDLDMSRVVLEYLIMLTQIHNYP